jgi:hypothetical protein
MLKGKTQLREFNTHIGEAICYAAFDPIYCTVDEATPHVIQQKAHNVYILNNCLNDLRNAVMLQVYRKIYG